MERRNSHDAPPEIVSLLQRFSAATEDLGRAFGTRHGLHHTSARAILEIMQAAETGGPITAGGLGDALGLTPASVTALVDRLVVAGLVRRDADPADRRRVLLVAEPTAVVLGERFFRPLAEDLSSMLEGYSEQERAVIGRFLCDATDTVRAHVQRPGRDWIGTTG